MKATRIALAFLSLAAIAACADGTSITAPSRPAFDAGGIGMGSGGKAAPDTTAGTTNTSTATADTATTPVDGRGIGMGSGG
ncbi:MAG TPA: hypothetical protein VGB92_06875 [Longimicrobium sp.]|jgi:hypothetical protein